MHYGRDVSKALVKAQGEVGKRLSSITEGEVGQRLSSMNNGVGRGFARLSSMNTIREGAPPDLKPRKVFLLA